MQRIEADLCNRKDFLTTAEIKLLEEKHRHCKEKRQAERIKTLLCLNRGDSYEEIARRLLLDESRLRNYYAEYLEGGREKLLEDNWTGGTSPLSYEQLRQWDKHLQEHTYLSSKEINAYIEKTYGIVYTTEGVKNILYRLGGSPIRKPNTFPAKPRPKSKNNFSKNTKH